MMESHNHYQTESHEQLLIKEVLRRRDVAVLAQMLRVSKKSVYRWINGEYKPHISAYKMLLDIRGRDRNKHDLSQK